MKHNLEQMTWDAWCKLTQIEKANLRDESCLSPQLVGLEGRRVEVETEYGEVRRFNVGKSTGWRPIHLEIHNRRCHSGASAERKYKSVRVVR